MHDEILAIILFSNVEIQSIFQTVYILWWYEAKKELDIYLIDNLCKPLVHASPKKCIFVLMAAIFVLITIIMQKSILNKLAFDVDYLMC